MSERDALAIALTSCIPIATWCVASYVAPSLLRRLVISSAALTTAAIPKPLASDTPICPNWFWNCIDERRMLFIVLLNRLSTAAMSFLNAAEFIRNRTASVLKTEVAIVWTPYGSLNRMMRFFRRCLRRSAISTSLPSKAGRMNGLSLVGPKALSFVPNSFCKA